jgi:polysaccharide export outer membrane protein
MWLVVLLALVGLGACSSASRYPPPPTELPAVVEESRDYKIAPLDTLSVFVWRAPNLSTEVLVRPDGRISMPLVEDVRAVGRTPSELARLLEEELAEFVQSPSVTVSVVGFAFGDAGDQTIRVVGEARTPTSVPYQDDLSVLDVMLAIGGLTEFANGNGALLIREQGDGEEVYNLRLDDLVNGGDTSVDVPLLPGDIILIPTSIL